MRTSTVRVPAYRFAFSGLVIVTACVFALRTHAAAANAAVAAWGLTFDSFVTALPS